MKPLLRPDAPSAIFEASNSTMFNFASRKPQRARGRNACKPRADNDNIGSDICVKLGILRHFGDNFTPCGRSCFLWHLLGAVNFQSFCHGNKMMLVNCLVKIICQIQPKRFQLGILVMGMNAIITPAKTRLLIATKGGGDIALAKSIHHHRAGFQRTPTPNGSLDVGGE